MFTYFNCSVPVANFQFFKWKPSFIRNVFLDARDCVLEAEDCYAVRYAGAVRHKHLQGAAGATRKATHLWTSKEKFLFWFNLVEPYFNLYFFYYLMYVCMVWLGFFINHIFFLFFQIGCLFQSSTTSWPTLLWTRLTVYLSGAMTSGWLDLLFFRWPFSCNEMVFFETYT